MEHMHLLAVEIPVSLELCLLSNPGRDYFLIQFELGDSGVNLVHFFQKDVLQMHSDKH